MLTDKLAPVMKQEIAYDDEEYALGVRGVGAGIRGMNGHIIGAISILAPCIRMTPEKMGELTLLVKQCAQNFSREMGYLMQG